MPVVTDMDTVVGVLKWVVKEMERRYGLLAARSARNIEAYNKQAEGDPTQKKMPFLVVVIDELADMMMIAGDEVERLICRLAQLARAAGIHLVVATQRPSVDVITGLIKANFPTRISFAVSSHIDSRTILDTAGAEKLLGRGDMLYLPQDASKPMRLQGAWVSDEEMKALVDFWTRLGQAAAHTEDDVKEIEALNAEGRGRRRRPVREGASRSRRSTARCRRRCSSGGSASATRAPPGWWTCWRSAASSARPRTAARARCWTPSPSGSSDWRRRQDHAGSRPWAPMQSRAQAAGRDQGRARTGLRCSVAALWALAARALLFFYSLVYAGHAANLAAYPYDVDQGEGYDVNSGWLIAQGRPIYTDNEEYPYYSSNYPPVFSWLLAPIVRRPARRWRPGGLLSAGGGAADGGC